MFDVECFSSGKGREMSLSQHQLALCLTLDVAMKIRLCPSDHGGRIEPPLASGRFEASKQSPSSYLTSRRYEHAQTTSILDYEACVDAKRTKWISPSDARAQYFRTIQKVFETDAIINLADFRQLQMFDDVQILVSKTPSLQCLSGTIFHKISAYTLRGSKHHHVVSIQLRHRSLVAPILQR